jgi:hypothetical protein
MRVLAFLAALTLVIPAQAQWTIQTPTTADLRGIDNVGKGIAWASGSNGTVLHTEDNGAHWQLCTIPPGAEHLDFRGIQAFDANTAIVMSSGKGDQSRLYKTTDACQTWKLVLKNADEEGFWDVLQFERLNPEAHSHTREGVLIGDPVNGHFTILTTSDLGESWHPFVGKHNDTGREESLFAASNTAGEVLEGSQSIAFVTGGKGGSYLYQEDPGGLVLDQFWSDPSLYKVRLGFAHSTSTEGAFSVAPRSTQNYPFEFMVVGGNYDKPEQSGFAAFLPQATFSWFMRHQKVELSTTPPHGYRSAVAYDAKTKTWITVGPNGTDISTDDGRNWRALKPGPQDPPDADQHWNALSLPFVVGPHGRIGILNPTALITNH